MRTLAVGTLLSLLPFLSAAGAEGPPENLLANSGFLEWKDDAPVGWRVEVGAQQGNGPVSFLSKGSEGGVRLAGQAETGTWRMLTQRVAPPAEATCRLSFEARLRDARLDPGQNDNRYVGVRILPPRSVSGARAPRFVVDAVLRDTWTPGEVVFRVGGGEVQAALFLSMTGGLEVRGLLLEVLPPHDSFNVMVRHMDRYYSYFANKGVDWMAHAPKHAAAFAAATEEAAFLVAAKALLAPLEDTHVWLRDAKGKVIPTWAPEIALNVDGMRLVGALPSPRFIGRIGIAADLGGDVGYLAVGTLAGTEVDHTALETELEGLLGKKGLVLDLRGNAGGDETRARRLVGRLMDEPRLYAKRRFRSGPSATDMGPWQEAWIRPLGERRFAGPIVVLIGPGCVSSGEGMAKMLRVRPRTLFLGQPTRGASGHPAPLPLPNGAEVWFSRWEDALPDGTATEGRGLAPDVLVPGKGPGDLTLMQGIAEIRRLLQRGG